jgi:septum formation protein
MNLKVILASSSVSRKKLLEDAGVNIFQIMPSDIDESRFKGEKNLELVKRLSFNKVSKISDKVDDAIIIAADTIVVCGSKMLDKAYSDQDVINHLTAMSGKRVNVITSVSIVKKTNNQIKYTKNIINKTVIKMRCLKPADIDFFVSTKDGIGKSGGFAIEGKAQYFVEWIKGSYSSVMGLPIYEVYNILKSLGYDFNSKSQD